MIRLTQDEAKQVNGGFLQALAAFVAVFTAPIVINKARKELNQMGRDASQATFDYLHPYDPNH